jgi:hypothetical protein
MSVVINEFEMVSGPEESESEATASPPPPAITPEDIEAVIQRSKQRAARIHAH